MATKYKYWWRPNVERALREYPLLKQKLVDLRNARLTQSYSPKPTFHGMTRSTEILALKNLAPREQQWVDAIEKALDYAELGKNGAETIALIDMIYFKNKYSVDGAAMKCMMSLSTAQRRIARFIDIVAVFAGYINYKEGDYKCQKIELAKSQITDMQ